MYMYDEHMYQSGSRKYENEYVKGEKTTQREIVLFDQFCIPVS